MVREGSVRTFSVKFTGIFTVLDFVVTLSRNPDAGDAARVRSCPRARAGQGGSADGERVLEKGELAIDDVIDVMGRATIEAVLQMSAAQVAGPKEQGRHGADREVYWHGVQAGRVALKERQLPVDKPRPRKKRPRADERDEAEVPAWEYKGKRADLDAAFDQLRQYSLALENLPLLIVSDMVRFRVRTNWTNCVSRTHEFELDDLADASTRNRLKWAFSDPDRLRPGETRQSLTERVAASFASVAQALRERGHEPQAVAHFVNRLVFCMFADDVGLLPDHMFTRMLRHAQPAP